MPYFVYVIQSGDDFYIGSTKDIKRRVQRHNIETGLSKKYKKNWKLIHREPYVTRSEAAKREIFLKRMKSRKFITKLIEGVYK